MPPRTRNASADLVALYKTDPALAERAQQALAEQAAHSRRMDWATVGLRAAGMLSGLLITFAFLYESVDLIRSGHAAAGVILSSVDLVALVTVFVVGRTARAPSATPSTPAEEP